MLGAILNAMLSWRGLGIAILAIVLYVIGAGTFGTGLSLSEMDWNGDGSTSIGEFFDTMDFGVGQDQINGAKCRRVYLLKDGMTVKELCP